MTDHTMPTGNSSILKDGLRAAWPICLGYVPIGLALPWMYREPKR